MRTCLALLVVSLMLSLDQRESLTTLSAAEHPSVPHNIIVHEPLTDIVVEMLRRSDTFRNQCRRLGLIRLLRVRVSLDPAKNPLARPECRATCVIRRYQFGRIEADVRLHTAMEAENLIAHELEHVREYVEGVNYLATSVQYPARVWTTLDGHYETARAIDAGEQVASEMLRHRARHATTTLARRAP